MTSLIILYQVPTAKTDYLYEDNFQNHLIHCRDLGYEVFPIKIKTDNIYAKIRQVIPLVKRSITQKVLIIEYQPTYVNTSSVPLDLRITADRRKRNVIGAISGDRFLVLSFLSAFRHPTDFIRGIRKIIPHFPFDPPVCLYEYTLKGKVIPFPPDKGIAVTSGGPIVVTFANRTLYNELIFERFKVLKDREINWIFIIIVLLIYMGFVIYWTAEREHPDVKKGSQVRKKLLA